MVYDTLYVVDVQGVPQPQMAEGHQLSDDKLTWTIKLREGLRFRVVISAGRVNRAAASEEKSRRRIMEVIPSGHEVASPRVEKISLHNLRQICQVFSLESISLRRIVLVE